MIYECKSSSVCQTKWLFTTLIKVEPFVPFISKRRILQVIQQSSTKQSGFGTHGARFCRARGLGLAMLLLQDLRSWSGDLALRGFKGTLLQSIPWAPTTDWGTLLYLSYMHVFICLFTIYETGAHRTDPHQNPLGTLNLWVVLWAFVTSPVGS